MNGRREVIVWTLVMRGFRWLLARKLRRNRGKLIAAGLVLAVLVGGVAAARSSGSEAEPI